MNNMLSPLYKLASPQFFYTFAGQVIPWLTGLTVLCFAYGIWGGLVLAPSDYQQGDGFRIIYLHVPSAFLSLLVYVIMAVAAVISLIWRIKLADILVRASAPLGAWFTFLALITGALWGKPMWGAWWIWDARLTSELILLFLYLGFIGLQSAIPDLIAASRRGNLLVIVGVVNIPIIHYSVYWWNTLHQGATLSKFAKPSIAPAMLYPLLTMIAAFLLYYLVVLLLRARCDILLREQRSQWIQQFVKVKT